MHSYSCTIRKTVIFSHTWEIKGFDLSNNCDQINGLRSEEFAASADSNNRFYIKLETDGNAPDKLLRIWLKKTSTNNCCNYTCESCISFGNKSYANSTINLELLSLKYSELYKEPKKILPDDSLKICFKINIALNNPMYTIPVPKRKILNDFGALLNSEAFADVTIVTGDDKKIPAHKAILSARSKVFAAMFKYSLIESQQNVVTISDFNYDVVLEMLRFIYTGYAPNLENMTEELLSAADKYDLERLKAIGLNYLNDNLCVENAAMTLKLADLYQEEGLKSRTIQYVQDNSISVFKTPIWMGLAKTDKINLLELIYSFKFDVE